MKKIIAAIILSGALVLGGGVGAAEAKSKPPVKSPTSRVNTPIGHPAYQGR